MKTWTLDKIFPRPGSKFQVKFSLAAGKMSWVDHMYHVYIGSSLWDETTRFFIVLGLFQKFKKWAWSVNFFTPARETTVALRQS